MLLVATMIAMTASAEIEAPGPLGPLRGTLERGAESAPVVLILPGSGPTDRNGNNPFGVRAAPYRLLAEGLAERGITTVRIDKRGLHGSGGANVDGNAVTVEDYVADTESWIGATRAQTGVSCVWLLGHSEGGVIALAAAQRAKDVCGLVLVATPGRSLGETLKAQLHADPANAPLLGAADDAIDSLSAGHRVDVGRLPAPLAPLFAPALQGFLISILPRDPAVLIARVQKPVLILQGERDLQVDPADAARLAAAAPEAVLKRLPDANHVLKAVPTDDRAANIASYADPDRPLVPGLVDTVADFVATPPTF